MGSSLASVSPRRGINRDRPLCWFDHRQREQKESTESATKNCMKVLLLYMTVNIPWTFLILQLVNLVSLRPLSVVWARSFLVDSNA